MSILKVPTVLALLLLAGSVATGSMAQDESAATPWGPRLTPSSSPEEIAQWAVNYLHCNEVNGHPRVLDLRLDLRHNYSPLHHPQAAVLLHGDFLVNGIFTGWSGWAPYVALLVDLELGGMAGASAGDDPQRLLDWVEITPPLSPNDPPWDIRPTSACSSLPNPSRSARMAQNCDARGFLITPVICGRVPQVTAQLTIELHDNAFVPADVAVPYPIEIVWVNRGDTYHTIRGPGWTGPVEMNPGDDWAVTYTSPAGTLEYYCTTHPDEMQFQLTIIATAR